MSDKSAFSRSGLSSPLGGMTAELPKIKLPEVTKEEFDRKARLAGMNSSEYLRYLVMVHVHGVDELMRLEHERLNLIANSWEERGRP